VKKIQRLMRRTFTRMQTQRAKNMHQRVQKAIIAYKTEKRREYEVDAA
jgi:hypothetical protein